MAQELGGDLGADVLIVGGGIQGLYLAQSLLPRYSVYVLSDPATASETLDSPGLLSAGYDGNDVQRIQPARRATGYWRLWAESSGVPHDYAPSYFVMPTDDEGMRTHLWSDAQLSVKRADSLPPIFGSGLLDAHSVFLAENDVVISPGFMVAKLREGLEDRIIWGEVIKFGIITDDAIDFVEIQTTDDQIVSITPRYIVLAANVGNGALLQRLVTAFKDRHKRKEMVDVMRGCQAVRRQTTIVARGDLPLIAGHFDGIGITAHPIGTGRDHVWVITAPIDDGATVLGPEEARFDPKLDSAIVRTTLDTVFAMSPELARRAPQLTWGAYNARKTEHPMMAVADTSSIAQPAPARLETLGMDGFVAVWPSHISYAMIVGDVVAERIETALGPAGDFAGGLQVTDLGVAPPEPHLVRWERPSFAWHPWSDFAATFDYTSPA